LEQLIKPFAKAIRSCSMAVNLTVSGAYLDTLVNAKGCDSILTLKFNRKSNKHLELSIKQFAKDNLSYLMASIERSQELISTL
jgi:hypothetical protein